MTSKKTATPGMLVVDIETSPLESYTWGLFDQNVGLNQIKTEWSILSYAAKWVGKKEIYYNDTSGKGAAQVRNDDVLLCELWTLLDEADIVVGQSVGRFDIRKINARMAMAGHGPYSPVRVIDTVAAAKKHFAYTSNKLAWLSEYLTSTKKFEHKKFPGFELWTECLKDNPKAWAEMKKYNILDVKATEQLYLKLRPWIEGHPNMGAYSSDKHACTKCGSTKTTHNGYRVTQQGRYARYQCQKCGGWSRGKVQLASLEERRKLLA